MPASANDSFLLVVRVWRSAPPVGLVGHLRQFDTGGHAIVDITLAGSASIVEQIRLLLDDFEHPEVIDVTVSDPSIESAPDSEHHQR